MNEQPMVEIPEINPQATAAQIAGVIKKLDTMPSSVSAEDLLNFMQDDLMPLVAKVHEEVSAHHIYLGMHEGRIGELEAGQGVGIPPEEAEELLQFCHASVAFFKSLRQTKEMKANAELEKLIDSGEKCIEIIEELRLDDEEDGPEGPSH